MNSQLAGIVGGAWFARKRGVRGDWTAYCTEVPQCSEGVIGNSGIKLRFVFGFGKQRLTSRIDTMPEL